MADREKNVKYQGMLKKAITIRLKTILIIIGIILVGIILMGASTYFLNIDDGVMNSDDSKNAPAAVFKYMNDVHLSDDEKMHLNKSPKEFWEELNKSGNRITAYLNSAEELSKLMRAQLALGYLDLRDESEIDKDLDWNEINSNIDSTEVQGVVKLKRALSNGKTITMTYVNEEKFQSYIDAYNNASNDSDREKAKNNALKHFTLEEQVSTNTDTSNQDATNQDATNQDATNQDATNQDATNQDTTNQDATNQNTSNQDTSKQDTSNQSKSKQDTSNQSKSKQDTSDQNTSSTNNSSNGTSQGEKIVAEALKYVGNPYVYGGNSLTNGIDCSHFVWRILQNSIGYSGGYTTSSGWRTRGQAVADLSQAGAGDVICFSGHVAIYDGNGKMVEAQSRKAGITSNREVKNNKILAIRRFTTDGIVKQGTKINTGSNTGNNSENGGGTTTKFIAKVATFSEHEESVTCDPDDPDVKEYHEHTYTMQEQEIDYQSMLNPYKLPFNYLWAMLVIGDDKDFVFDLSDLAFNSKMEITVHDNLQKNTDIITDEYTKKTEIETNGNVAVSYKDSNGNTGEESKAEKATDVQKTKYKKIHKTIDISNTLDTCVTLADTWNITYTKEYKYSSSTNDSGKSTKKLDDKVGDWTNTDSPNLNSQIKSKAESEVASEGKSVSSSKINSSTTKVKRSTVDASTATQNKIELNEYTTTLNNVSDSTSSKNKDKEEISDDTGGTYKYNNNFANILKKNHAAKSSIINASEWLFEILEKNSDTADMVDLTKYLLFKATGNDYGVTKLDISIFSMSRTDNIGVGNSKYTTLSVTSTNLTKGDFVKKVQSYSPALSNSKTKIFRDNAGVIYDVCVKNNVNPVLCAAQAYMEQGWVAPSTSPYNYWGIAVYNGQNYGQSYTGMEHAVQVYCKNINERLQGKHEALEWSKKCAQYDDHFAGSMNTVYDVLSNWACASKNPTPAEQAQCAAVYVTDIINKSAKIFGQQVLSAPYTSTGGGETLANGGKGTRGIWTSKTTGQKFNLYLQGDGAPWAKNPYGGSGTMSAAGCGPTALAIIASGYNGSITPETVRDDIINKRHHGAVANYSNPAEMKLVVGDLNLNVSTSIKSFNTSNITSCLRSGGKIWFIVGNCKYTGGRHCMALIDYDASTGKVYVAHGSSRTFGWETINYLLRCADSSALFIN